MNLTVRITTTVACSIIASVTAETHAGEDPPFIFEPCNDCGILPYEMPFGMGAGVAAADFDNDGDIDLFLPNAFGNRDQLYVNQGDGTFSEEAVARGVGTPQQSRTALWIDTDGDQDLDLLVANDDPDRPSTYTLYQQNDDHTFTDITEAAGLFIELNDPVKPNGLHRGGLSAGDLNNDGWLDIVSCMWNGPAAIFFNNGDGTFTDVTEATGITTYVPYTHQAMLFDVNQDGWLDIYLAVDFLWNTLYINQGDGTFIDIAEDANCDNAWNDMGIALGDYDRDGDFDLFITNITYPGVHSILLRNDSNSQRVTFTEVSQSLNVDEGGWAWGVTFLDADNDGWLDIAATNGWHTPKFINDPSRFFWNRTTLGSEPAFDDVSDISNFNDTEYGSSLIAADFDRDGDLDIAQTCMNGPFRVLRNNATTEETNNFITIRPRWDAPNHHAIGALVEVIVDGNAQRRLITAGTSYLGQEPAESHFGLADADRIDTVRITWPDGTLTCVHDVEPNQLITITPEDGTDPDSADLNNDGLVDVSDLLDLLANWGPCPDNCTTDCPADIDGADNAPDCIVDQHDLLKLLAQWGC